MSPPLTPEACSSIATRLDEPLVGTAVHTVAWLLVEVDAGWGPKGLPDAPIPSEVRDALVERTDALGVRVQLVRRPGRDSSPDAPFVALAHSSPSGTWIRAYDVASHDDLGTVDVALATVPTPPETGREIPPVILVCSHGRRDRCCASLGRPVAAVLAARWPEAVWETTHTGGHRFAPTAVVLPVGVNYGRLDLGTVIDRIEELLEGDLALAHLRGRNGLTRSAQAAEIFARRALDLNRIDALTFVDGAPDGDVHRVLADGVSWTVKVRKVPTGTPRPLSSGSDELQDPGVWELVQLRRS